jgi:hypothetical protein
VKASTGAWTSGHGFSMQAEGRPNPAGVFQRSAFMRPCGSRKESAAHALALDSASDSSSRCGTDLSMPFGPATAGVLAFLQKRRADWKLSARDAPSVD